MSLTQRFFLTNTAAGYTPATLRGAWDATASAVTKKLGRLPSGSTTTIGVAETSTTNNWDVLLYRAVSDPLDKSYSFTTSDKVQLCAGFKESNASANDFVHLHVYVTQGDSDTPRGTLLTDSIGATEFTTTAGFRTEGQKTLSAVSAQAGDRIVVEIGYQGQNTSATSFTGTMNYGGVDQSGISGGTNVTVAVGWVEFTLSDILFNVSPVTLNPSDAWGSLTFSNGNRVISYTNASGSEQGGCARATFARDTNTDTGVYVLAWRIKKFSTTEGSPDGGFSLSSMPTTDQPGFYTGDGSSFGSATNFCFLGLAQQIWFSGSSLGPPTTPPPYGEGDTLFIVMDCKHRVFYQRVNSGNWYGYSSSNSNPDTDAPGLGGANAQGYDWSSVIVNGQYFPTANIDNDNGQTSSIEFDASAWGHGLTNVKPWDTPSSSTASLTFDNATSTGISTVTSGGGSTSTGSVTFDNMTISASSISKVQSALNLIFDNMTAALASTAKGTSQLAVTFADMTISAASTAKASANAVLTFADLVASGVSSAVSSSALGALFGDMAIAASSVARASSSAAITFADMTISAVGGSRIGSALSGLFADMTIVATSIVEVSSNAALSFGDMVSNGTSVVGSQITATLSGLFDDMTIAASSIVKTSSLANISFADMVSAGVSTVKLASLGTVTFADMAITAVSGVSVQSAAAMTFADMISTASSVIITEIFSFTPRFEFQSDKRNNEIGIVDRVHQFTAAVRNRSFTAAVRSFTFAPKPKKDGN